METVKVDTHKLQLLNEHLTQAIDALNQLRQSAHAVQAGMPTGVAGLYAPPPYGFASPYGFNVYGPVAPYGQFNPVAYAQPTYPSSPYGQPTFASSPYGHSSHGHPAFAPFIGYPGSFAGNPGHMPGAPVMWTIPVWGLPSMSNGSTQASWRPEWQSRSGQSWPGTSAE